MKTDITIHNGRGTQVVPGTPIAKTVFAITPGTGTGYRWTLTHRPTGYRAMGANTVAVLRRIAHNLQAAAPAVTSADAAVIRHHAREWLTIINGGTR